MQNIRKIALLASLLCIAPIVFTKPAHKIAYKNGDFEAVVSGKLETESSFDVNARLFNKHAHDKIMATKTKFDLNLVTATDMTRSKVSIRSKVTWGNHRILNTDTERIFNIDTLTFDHSHMIPVNFIWTREMWLEMNLSKMFNMTGPDQAFMIGAFPFQLGRGIALGDAYTINPSALGFFQDTSVDQYAFGFKLSGGIIEDFMKYDVYCAVLDNKSTSLKETNFPTQIHAFGGSKTSDARGAGKINFLSAARLLINSKLTDPEAEITIEPYWMLNYAPEQQIEYPSDASSKLVTTGFAIEFVTPRFEAGLDCAVNFGGQKVKGWDRNYINQVNLNGVTTFVYSSVYNIDPTQVKPTSANNVVYDPSNKAQVAAINAVTPGALSNGQQIDGTTLYNAVTRYRTPYINNYKGFMWVGDIAYWIIPKNVAVSFAGGVASGDQNPNFNLSDPDDLSVDGNYNGFIPFQEVYFGKRVQSFYMLTSSLQRPLSVPASGGQYGSQYATVANNFSNIMFGGGGITYVPQWSTKGINFNPNMLFYWANCPSNKYDLLTKTVIDEPASNNLGTEVNVFFKMDFSENVVLSTGFALFFPGKHYSDIQGKPISSSQEKLLQAAKTSSLPLLQYLPLIGTNTVLSSSFALIYTF